MYFVAPVQIPRRHARSYDGLLKLRTQAISHGAITPGMAILSFSAPATLLLSFSLALGATESDVESATNAVEENVGWLNVTSESALLARDNFASVLESLQRALDSCGMFRP